jgi:hypothetical protein
MAWWEANPKARSKGRKSSARKWTWGGWGTGGSKTRPKARPKTARKVAKAARSRKSSFRWFGWGSYRRPGWKGEGRAHAVAAKIGWTYRKYARQFARFGSYAARGTSRGKHRGLRITPRSLAVYRKARRTPLSRLEGRREWFKHKSTGKKTYAGAMMKARRKFGMLYNASAYQKFVAKFTKGARGSADARRRFKAAAKAWKRSRKNPVLPVSYSNPKRRKTRRSNSNPLFRTATGRFGKRGGRRLRRIKGGGWHANRARRAYRNSPILPYTAYSNPMAAVAGTFREMADVSMWTRTILPLTAGFVGTHALSVAAAKFILPSTLKYDGVVKHGVRALSAATLSVGVGLVTKDSDMAAKVLAGGLVAVLGGVLSDVIGDDFKKMTGLGEMNDLADDLTEDLKARIAEGVRKQFSGDDSLDGDDDTISSFVTTEDLNRAPRLGDFVSSEALKKATVGTDMPGRTGGGPPREGNALADLGTFQDALADGSLI